MNEQIKLLAKQAGFSKDKYNLYWDEDANAKGVDLEKFAELIIAECTKQVRGEYVPVLEDEAMMKDTHWDGYVQCGVDAVVAIREHFYGVEE